LPILIRNISTFALRVKLQHDGMAEPYPKRRKTSAMSTQTRRPTHHFDKNDCFTLIVGPDRNEILVHANYLVQDSEFFKNMLAQQWFVPTIVLPDVDYETMTNYLTFAYIEKLPTAHMVGPVCETFTGDEYLSLAHSLLPRRALPEADIEARHAGRNQTHFYPPRHRHGSDVPRP
jgi:hypothetical protein